MSTEARALFHASGVSSASSAPVKIPRASFGSTSAGGGNQPRVDTKTSIVSLTTRERQVLRLLAAGVSTRETAARLTISPKTVDTHRMRIYARLGCKSAVELTHIVVRAGLIEA